MHFLSNCFRGLYSIAFALCVIGSCLNGVQAQSVHDAGQWSSLNLQGDLKFDGSDHSRIKWWFDGHMRLFDDADGYGQSIVRPAIGYKLRDNVTVWLGYGWINETNVAGNNFDENRIFQQLIWTRKFQQINFQSRTRLEQRFVETGNDMGWRFRQFNKFLRPFEFNPQLSAILWNEAFIDLNQTDWGQAGTFSQNRLFSGFGWTLEQYANQPRVEIGYMHQFIRRPGADDTHNHVLGINWFANF